MKITIILILALYQGAFCQNDTGLDSSFYDYLILNGCNTTLEFEEIKNYINQDQIKHIGRFNHYTELLSIGFKPNASYPHGSEYDKYWLSFIIYQMNEIANNSVILKLPQFDIDSKDTDRPSYFDLPEKFNLRVNDSLININLEKYNPKSDVERVQILMNNINKELLNQKIEYRFIILESYRAKGKTYPEITFIGDYRISFLPQSFIKILLDNEDIRIDNSFLNINQTLNSKKTALTWGNRLPFLSEIINPKQLVYFDGDNHGFLTGEKKLKLLFDQFKIQYDKCKLKVFSSNEFTSIMSEFNLNQIDTTTVNSRNIELDLTLNNKKFTYRFGRSGLRNLLWEEDFFRFINNYLKETNQDKIISSLHKHHLTLELNISLLKWFIDQENWDASYKSIPHLSNELSLVNEIVDVVVIQYNCSNEILLNIGYVRMDKNEIKKYCH